MALFDRRIDWFVVCLAHIFGVKRHIKRNDGGGFCVGFERFRHTVGAMDIGDSGDCCGIYSGQTGGSIESGGSDEGKIND